MLTRRIITYNKDGLVKEEESITPIVNKFEGNANVDETILISTDAASKITERAIGLAFDKWAAEILTEDMNQDQKGKNIPDKDKSGNKKSISTTDNRPKEPQITKKNWNSISDRN